MNNKTIRGRIFNIQKFCVHDGPGIRTTAFLQGCPLHCIWCSNPESQPVDVQLGYKLKECMHCLRCIQACTHGALSHTGEKGIAIDRGMCTSADCGAEGAPCVAGCPKGALFSFGRTVSSKELVDSAEADCSFYSRSGGGLTLSGGEPLFQAPFAIAILHDARERGIHTAIETTAYCSREVFHRACSNLSYLIMDIKLINSEQHVRWCGVQNSPILENYLYARRTFPDLPIKVRTPVIPGVNDCRESIEEIARFLSQEKPTEYELLEYHALGENKYNYLGKNYELEGAALGDGTFEELKKIATGILS